MLMTVGELVADRLCDGACLVATGPRLGCDCRCRGKYHGALSGVEVVNHEGRLSAYIAFDYFRDLERVAPFAGRTPEPRPVCYVCRHRPETHWLEFGRLMCQACEHCDREVTCFTHVRVDEFFRLVSDSGGGYWIRDLERSYLQGVRKFELVRASELPIRRPPWP